ADLSGVDFSSDSIFFGVNFNAAGEIAPRIRFTSVPYAFSAEKVTGANLQIDGNGLITNPGTTRGLNGVPGSVSINDNLTIAATSSAYAAASISAKTGQA